MTCNPEPARTMEIAARTLILVVSGSLAAIGCAPSGDSEISSAGLPAQTFATDFAAPTGRAVTIEDYYRIRSLRGPRISPGGAWVVYSISSPVEETNDDRVETWVVAADGGGEPAHVLHEGEDVSGPRWTDDGLLQYVADGTWTIDLGDPDASPVRVAPPDDAANAAGGGPSGGGGRGGGGAGQSTPSPDGTWVAMLEEIPYPIEEQVIASEFEQRHQERFEGAQFDWMYFQRDGQEFPVADPRTRPAMEISIAPAGATAATDGSAVASGIVPVEATAPSGGTPKAGGTPPADGSPTPRRLTELGLRPSGLAWRPDNSMIVFTADTDFRDELTYGRSDLWTVTADGEVTRLTDDGYNYGSTAFSPDGRFISYTRSFGTDMIIEQGLDHGGSRDLFILPADGGEPVNLTADWDLDPGAPRWEAEGSYIYFTAGIGGSTHLFRVGVDGGPVEQVTEGERRIGSLTIDRDFRTIAYTVGRIEAPSELFVANIDGSEERQLTNIHNELIEEITFSRAERLLFASYDGTPIEGWLLYPYGYSPEDGPYPMVVNSHGGPHSASGYGFSFKHQYFAANGYFVLQTNFRSSTGYGDDFKWATWGAWGDKDGEDVMAGVDYAIDNFAIDPDRVGVTGHSYGGFMSNWLITQYPDRIAAAVVGAGISNWISDYGTADIARTKETEFFGTPWEEEARERLIRQSPLTYAGRVTAPTLFIHGEVDQRVPYEEAEQMYFAIKKQGVPAKMIRYAGMSHGIRGHWNVVHRAINELAWWEKWLTGSDRTSPDGG